jgi:hypothetical protein
MLMKLFVLTLLFLAACRPSAMPEKQEEVSKQDRIECSVVPYSDGNKIENCYPTGAIFGEKP